MYKVYAYTNQINGKRYVGCSSQYEKRQRRHLRDLSKGEHHSILLQQAWNKKNSSFTFEVIKCFRNKKRAYAFEEKTIALDIDSNLSYNIAVGMDNISNHPRRKQILNDIKTDVIKRVSKMSADERRKTFGKRGSKNHNWKGGSTKANTTCLCGNKKSWNALSCTNCRTRDGDMNPFYGKTHSIESKLKISLAKKGKPPSHSTRIRIDGVVYESQVAAAKALGVSNGTIYHRLKSSNPLYKRYKVLSGK